MDRDKLEKRARLIRECREILDRAEGEGRELTAEESEGYDRRWQEIERLGEEIERERKLAEAERWADTPQGEPVKEAPAAEDRAVSPRGSEEYRNAFRRYLRTGLMDVEYRALQADNDPAGGYIVAPEQFVAQLLKAIDDAVFVRRLATMYQVPKADGLGVPALEANPADADWTSELLTGDEDSTMAFGRRELKPNPLAKRIKISNKLIAASVFDVEALVRDRLAYKFAIAEEKAFLLGNGSGKPLGVFEPSAQGISTSRDISNGNATTSIKFDGLIEAKFALKTQYWPRAQWLFHRDAVKQVAKLKDGDGQYIWRESTRVGEPDRLLGLPVNISEYVPNTFTTGQYVGILGDFSYYWIADAMNFQVQRLVELYAETNQVGFIGRLECDGMPVLEEAFVRVKLA